MYTLTLSTGTVIRDADGVQVAPVDSANNPDFIAYNDWVYAGNQPTIIEMSQAQIDAANAQIVSDTINSLWQAAHDWEYQYINGVAIGLLALGVAKASPISMAIAAWDAGIWNLYYSRKANVTINSDSTILDFSSCGPMPYTIPELRTELGF